MITVDVHAHLACQKNLDPAEKAATLAFAQSMSAPMEEDFPVTRLLSEMHRVVCRWPCSRGTHPTPASSTSTTR